jgi:DNA-binding transcriptional ArsR family regulator
LEFGFHSFRWQEAVAIKFESVVKESSLILFFSELHIIVQNKHMISTSTDALAIDAHGLKKAALFFRAVNHPLRQRLLQRLHKEGEQIVTSLYIKMDLEQSVCSQHLAILRRAMLVKTRRDGKQIYYAVNYTQLKKLHSLTIQLLQG